MTGKAYLSRTMLARLLACLALVTGLAAVGAPVNATLLTASSQQVESDGSASNPSKSATCAAWTRRSTRRRPSAARASRW